MKAFSQWEINGTLWSVELPTDNVANVTIQIASEYNGKTTENFIAVKVFGGLRDKAESLPTGAEVHATGYFKSREYNGKNYTDLLCNSLLSNAPRKEQPTEQVSTDPEDGLPF